MDKNRIVKLDGARNIRDLGGLYTSNGIIKTKKILRGNALDRITPNDINILTKQYNLKYVIDLRTELERAEREDIIIPNVNYLAMPIFNKKVPGITHEKGVNNGLGSISMAKLYEEVLTGEYLNNINEILKTIILLSEEDGSILFHCTAGKDRTGIITALLLLILGVDEEDIVDDYLYTNKVNKRILVKYSIKSIVFTAEKEDIVRMKNIIMAKEEYIQAVFDFVEEKYGNIENYIFDCLGIDSETVEKFKRNIIK